MTINKHQSEICGIIGLMIRSIKEIIQTKARRKITKNIAYEFQDFGVRLSQSLGDLKNKSLYIKLSKEVERGILERARDFALGYHKPKSKGKVFMWYLKELRWRDLPDNERTSSH